MSKPLESIYRPYTGRRLSVQSTTENINSAAISRPLREARPELYLPSAQLTDAVNVALLLGQPLLLTGEPGTGKTQFAHNLAWSLGLHGPLVFETKTISGSKDLFYQYNAIGRFHAAQTGEGSQGNVDYISYNALGLAIILANEPSVVKDLLPTDFVHDHARRSVVLIDEVDKAPRDFPNDILSEIEGMYFKLAELGNRCVSAPPNQQPVVIITSNSEKHLPEAFLRRCVFHHVEFPGRQQLEDIVLSQLQGDFRGIDGTLSTILDVFVQMRQEPRMRKRPATAELLAWLFAIQRQKPDGAETFRTLVPTLVSTIGCIAKNWEDHQTARRVIETWPT